MGPNESTHAAAIMYAFRSAFCAACRLVLVMVRSLHLFVGKIWDYSRSVSLQSLVKPFRSDHSLQSGFCKELAVKLQPKRLSFCPNFFGGGEKNPLLNSGYGRIKKLSSPSAETEPAITPLRLLAPRATQRRCGFPYPTCFGCCTFHPATLPAVGCPPSRNAS